MRITKPGLYHDVPEALYHADPCPEPSLSSSIAKTICAVSPLHAIHECPRIMPPEELLEKETSAAMDFGSAVHKLILDAGEDIHVVPANDWRGGAAKEARTLARAEHKIPLLSKDMERAEFIADAFRAQMEMFRNANPMCHELVKAWDSPRAMTEVSGFCQDPVTGIWMRSRGDRVVLLDDGTLVIFDLKTTGQVAAPQDLPRTFANLGYHISDTFYRTVFHQLIPEAKRVVMVFLVIEAKPPHVLQFAKVSERFAAIGARDVRRACDVWAHGLSTGHWAAWEPVLLDLDPPAWFEKVYYETEERRDEQRRILRRPDFAGSLAMQAPLGIEHDTNIGNILGGDES